MPLLEYILTISAIFFVGSTLHHYFKGSDTGWRLLAGMYTYEQRFAGETWSSPDANFRRSGKRETHGYGYFALVVGANVDGMYFRLRGPFRLAHPPLLVPWSDIRVDDLQKGWIRHKAWFYLGRDSSVEMLVYGKPAQELHARVQSHHAVV